LLLSNKITPPGNNSCAALGGMAIRHHYNGFCC
jgi:hypothetical protein